MEQLKRYVWPIATGGVVLLIVIVGLLAWISPEGKKVSAANAKNSVLQAQETSLQLQIATLEHESKQEPKNCSTLKQDQTLVPPTPTVDLFLHQISQLATNAGTVTPSVTITTSSGTSTSGANAGGAESVGIDLSVSGSYQQVLNFLNGLDNVHSLQRLYSVSQVSLSSGTSDGSGGGYSLSLQGNIYYSSGAEDVCSTSKSNAGSSTT